MNPNNPTSGTENNPPESNQHAAGVSGSNTALTDVTASEPCSSVDDCREAVAELFEFLSGELTDERRVVIDKHLDDCSHCLDVFEFHAELRTVVSERCRTELPEGLKNRVLGALRALED